MQLSSGSSNTKFYITEKLRKFRIGKGDLVGEWLPALYEILDSIVNITKKNVPSNLGHSNFFP